MLVLPDVTRVDVPFTLFMRDSVEVTNLTVRYQKAKKAAQKALQEGMEPEPFFWLATKALLTSIHPRLIDKTKNAKVDENNKQINEVGMLENPAQGLALLDTTGNERDEFVGKLDSLSAVELVNESKRTAKFFNLLQALLQKHTNQKIVVFSMFLSYLDVLDKCIRDLTTLTPYRFDGSLEEISRSRIQREFNDHEGTTIMLITAGARGVGLNLQSASIMIQTEVWWDVSNEWQAIARIYRQGQTERVHVFQLTGVDMSGPGMRRLRHEGWTSRRMG